MNINLTIIGQSIAFLFFVWFTYAFVWKHIRTVLDERADSIADGLEAADRAERDLKLAQEKATSQMAAAKADAAGVLDSANKRASQIVEEAKDQAKVEAERVKTSAKAEIEQDANRAREDLRSKVASLALIGAEKVLGNSIDADANKSLVDKLAAEL